MLLEYGSRELRSVIVESYNIEIRDGDRFLGDRANKRIDAAELTNGACGASFISSEARVIALPCLFNKLVSRETAEQSK